MLPKNAYPNLPVFDYERTQVSLDEVFDYMNNGLHTQYALEVLRSAWVIFYNESAAGKKGVNNNYNGIQTDGSKLGQPWDDLVIGTVVIKDNMTGNYRRFAAFENWQTSVHYTVDRVYKRGLYIGGFAHPYSNMRIGTVNDLARAYGKEWVEGDKAFEMPEKDIEAFTELYNSTEGKFNMFN